jgi:hypothetical protein
MSVHGPFSPEQRLVLIEWIDAAGPRKKHLGWISVETAVKNVKLERIQSVGWLIRDDVDSYLVAPNLVADGSCDSATAIPKAWVDRFVELVAK